MSQLAPILKKLEFSDIPAPALSVDQFNKVPLLENPKSAFNFSTSIVFESFDRLQLSFGIKSSVARASVNSPCKYIIDILESYGNLQ